MSALTMTLTVAVAASALLVTARLIGLGWRSPADRAWCFGWALIIVAVTIIAISHATDGPAPGPQLMQLGAQQYDPQPGSPK